MLRTGLDQNQRGWIAMRNLWMAVTLLFAVGAAAADRDIAVDPGNLSLRETSNGTEIKFRARPGSVTITAGESPLLSGAQFQLFNSAGGMENLCAQLPASNWSGGPLSFAYRDPHGVYGPVNKAHFGRVGHGGLADIRVIVRHGSYPLDASSQGSIGASLRMSNALPPTFANHTRYCTNFAPPYATIGPDVAGKFRGKFNPPNQFQGPCPVAPSVCSPSGAFLDDPST
jgi:hypothetical protein